MYEYIDGNANKYIIKKEGKITIEYVPMKSHLSSSGFYDGGDYTKKKISSQDWNNLILIFKEAIGNKEIHIKNRVKRSGIIIIQEENKKKTYIIRPNSEIISEIEKNLQDILKN